MIDEGDEEESEDTDTGTLLPPPAPIAEPESLPLSSIGSNTELRMEDKMENKRVIMQSEREAIKSETEAKNVFNLVKTMPSCGKVNIVE